MQDSADSRGSFLPDLGDVVDVNDPKVLRALRDANLVVDPRTGAVGRVVVCPKCDGEGNGCRKCTDGMVTDYGSYKTRL